MKLGAKYERNKHRYKSEEESYEFLTLEEETYLNANGVPSNRSFGWRDIEGPIQTHRAAGTTVPVFEEIAATGMYAFNFSLNDFVLINFHVPHDYVPGTDIHFHTHWTSDGTDANTTVWQYEYAYSDGYGAGVFNLGTLGTASATSSAASGTAYTHYITETTGVTIANMEPDGIIMVKMTRLTNGASDNADNIYVITSDVHYQSTNWATVNRNTPFYN